MVMTNMSLTDLENFFAKWYLVLRVYIVEVVKLGA